MAETDAEFVKRMKKHARTAVAIVIGAEGAADIDRLFAIADRGAAIADQERKTRIIMGDPLKGFSMPWEPCCVCGSKYATRGEGTLPDGRWVCSRACENMVIPLPPAGEQK
jgi:hypothetical protein